MGAYYFNLDSGKNGGVFLPIDDDPASPPNDGDRSFETFYTTKEI